MRKAQKTALLLITAMSINLPVASEQPLAAYGKKGGVEMSLGASNLSSSNFKTLVVDLLPNVNHFVLDQIFLRYGLDIGMSFQTSNSYRIAPVFGIGFSLPLTGRWYLNTSIYYRYGYIWYTAPFTDFSKSYQAIGLAPELKYQISDNWIISLMIDLNTNLPYLIDARSKELSVYTTSYLSFSYYLP